VTRRRQHSTRGFTLVELLVVIVILGVLAGIVVFAVNGISDRGQNSACAADTQTITHAEEAYFAQHGTYASEGTLATSGGLLSSESTLHDVTLSGQSYTIINTGTCGISFPTDGFEPPAVAAVSGSFDTYNNGSSFGPWSVVGGSVDVVSNAYWQQPVTATDTQDVDLNGNSAGTIQRSITGLTAGNTYTLSFRYAVNNECAASAGAHFTIGDLDSTLTASNAVKPGGTFNTSTSTFTAGSATETLRFNGSTGGACGVVLDNISIS
jgi:prepilin-type N-terminal cleavage/methylation domain-containing protein